jgi:hypothetical protein
LSWLALCSHGGADASGDVHVKRGRRRAAWASNLSYRNPESESYRRRELGEPQRLPEMVLKVCSCLIFPTLIRRSPTSLCLRSLTGQRLFPRRSLSPTRSRTCCRLSHPSRLGMMFRRSANEASSVEEIAKPVVSGPSRGSKPLDRIRPHTSRHRAC